MVCDASQSKVERFLTKRCHKHHSLQKVTYGPLVPTIVLYLAPNQCAWIEVHCCSLTIRSFLHGVHACHVYFYSGTISNLFYQA